METLKESNVNHNNMPNSEPGTGAGDATVVGGLVCLWFLPPVLVAMVTLINAARCRYGLAAPSPCSLSTCGHNLMQY